MGTKHGLSIAERFWAKVDKTAGPEACWPWTGYRHPRGYGQFTYAYSDVRWAQRVAYELTHGKIGSKKLFVCHRCDHPPCCNPAHLFLGTAKDNHDDMVRKGRHSRGDRAREAIRRARVSGPKPRTIRGAMKSVTQEQIREMVARRKRGEPFETIGAEMNVAASTVWKYTRTVLSEATPRQREGTEGERR